MRWNWQVTIISSAMVSLVATCSATIIHVPQEYPTIQAGIDAAVDLDTVLVADGIYTGYGNRDIDFFGKDIVVMSKNGEPLRSPPGSRVPQWRGFERCASGFHDQERMGRVRCWDPLLSLFPNHCRQHNHR